MLKKYNITKSYNIIKKINGCLKCHEVKNSENNNIIGTKINILYKKLYNFKFLKKMNLIMNNILLNIKNKFILDICKYLNKVYKFDKGLLINIKDFIWRW